jgi:hypothetical protein
MDSQPLLHVLHADGLLSLALRDNREVMKVLQESPIVGERQEDAFLLSRSIHDELDSWRAHKTLPSVAYFYLSL